MTVTNPASRLAALTDTALEALHKHLDAGDITEPATVEAHHLVTHEMAKRGLGHGHDEDLWSRAVIKVDEAWVDSIDDVEFPEQMREPLEKALEHGGHLQVLMTVDNYVLKADAAPVSGPTVNTVHVDSVMGSKRPRAVLKRIVERDGRYVVMAEDSDREFGTYDTRSEAEARLRQIERFAKADEIKVDQFVSWRSAGGPARGQITRIVTEGTLDVPDTDFTLNASEEDPAVLIRVFRPTSQGWRPTDTLVGHRASTLRRIEPLAKADSYEIPSGVQAAAKQALRWIADGLAGDGFTSVGRNRARQLADGGSVGRATLVKMRAYFARHGVDKQADGWGDKSDPTPGMVAWYAWGGDAGRSWAREILGSVKKDLDLDMDEIDEDELLETMDEDDLAEFGAYAYLADEDDDMEKAGNPEALRDYWRGGGKGKISWGAGGDFTACVAAVSKYMTSEQAKGYCAIRHREVNGFWPGDRRNRAKKAAYEYHEAAATFTLPDGAVYTVHVPVAKHGSHDQSSHGRRGSGGGAATAEGGGGAAGGGSSYGGYELKPVDNPPAVGRPDNVVAAAQAVRAKAAAAEPQITKDMIDVANKNGGTLEGLDYRLKAEKSLARKIDDEKAELGGDVEATAAKMSDVVRYTATFEDSNYVAGVQSTISDLEAQGYTLRVKNYWAPDDPYQGINVAAVHPSGQKFELQFHTPGSLAAKEPIHSHYETYRESRDNRTRWKSYSRMTRMARKIAVPTGSVLAIGEPLFQGFQTAQEAGLI